MSKFKDVKATHGYYVLLMLLACVAGYGAFLLNAPIYDFINQFFPCRYFTTECIRNGIFPLWNPYQSMGTPFHSDPQSGVFYLPMWLFAFCGKYTAIFCGIEFVFHAFMAAVGFYWLAWHFSHNKNASFVTACCYALSGFFIGNAQHLVWIVAATWIPWIVCACCLFLENPSLKTSLLIPLPLSLMVSGGYPGAYFILFYLVLTLVAVYLVKALCQRNWAYVGKMSLYGLVTVSLIILLCAPTLISQLEIKPLISRGMKLTVEQTGLPLTIQSLLSIIFPYVSVSESAFIHTDISMANIYMGLFAIPFAVYGLVKNRNMAVLTIAAFGLFSLIMAFGAQTRIFKLIFQYVPFIGFIRLPSLFRIYFILSTLLLSAIGMKDVIENYSANSRNLRLLGVVFFAFFIVLTFLLVAFSNSQFQFSNWKNGSLSQKCMVESCMAAVFSVLFFFTFFIKNKDIAIKVLTLLLLSDVVVQANLCGPQTIYDTNKDKAELAKAYSVPAYTIPQETLDCEDIVHKYEAWAYWRNVGPFFKEVEWWSLNPCKLNTYSKMLAMYRQEDQPLRISMVFCPKFVVYDTTSHWLNTDTVYVDDFSLAKNYEADGQCRLVCFEPGHVTIKASVDTTRPVVLCQNYYKGWQATIDGERPLEIRPANFAMMAFYIPSGNHTIDLQYRRPFYVWAFVIQSVLSILILILFVLFYRSRFLK